MNKFLTTSILAILALPAYAGSMQSAVTISETLTLTSPSAIISATGVSATAYITNISTTNLAAANISSTAISVGANTITSGLVPIATALISTTSAGCTVLSSNGVITGCTRIAGGQFGVSGTFVNTTYKPICFDVYTPGNIGWANNPGTGAPHVDGFRIGGIAAAGPLAALDLNQFSCVVYP